MLFNYQEFLDGIDREAYHAGEWRWEDALTFLLKNKNFY